MSIAGAAIQGGTQLLGGLFNNMSVARQNRKSRIFAKSMYDRQYKDSLAFWNMQNEYNTPEAQMQRFKNAGLNPNLIYGQGNSGNAGSLSPPSVNQPSFNPADWSSVSRLGSSVLAGYYALERGQAEVDKLRSANTVDLENAALIQAKRIGQGVQNARGIIDYNLEKELYQTNLDARKENLRQMKAETQFKLDENERRAAMNAANLRESLVKVLNMRLEGKRLGAAISNLWKDAELKQLDIELRRQGINPNHPMYAQILGRLLNKYANPQTGNNLWQGFKDGNRKFWDSINPFK